MSNQLPNGVYMYPANFSNFKTALEANQASLVNKSVEPEDADDVDILLCVVSSTINIIGIAYHVCYVIDSVEFSPIVFENIEPYTRLTSAMHLQNVLDRAQLDG